LPVSRAATVVFPTPEFLDVKLLAQGCAKHYRLHGCPAKGGTSQLQTRFTRYCQDLIELELASWGEIAIINDQFLTLFDFILTSAVGNNRVHRYTFNG
jgi:hypothetical protein